jgi:uncharacterized membrane-anchored protein YitT (DUF2179 family)
MAEENIHTDSHKTRRRRKPQKSSSHKSKTNWLHIVIAVFIAIGVVYFITHRDIGESGTQAYATY